MNNINKIEKDELIKKYFKNGKLHSFPSKRNKQIAILEIFGDYFQENKIYSEIEINNIIKKKIDCRDYVTIRRDLIDLGIIKRNPFGSIYYKESRSS